MRFAYHYTIQVKKKNNQYICKVDLSIDRRQYLDYSWYQFSTFVLLYRILPWRSHTVTVRNPDSILFLSFFLILRNSQREVVAKENPDLLALCSCCCLSFLLYLNHQSVRVRPLKRLRKFRSQASSNRLRAMLTSSNGGTI